jgi:16S rRNA (guanine966-N2)-methyltransferase
VREAVFSILGDVSGLRVLDLYAGTGALGIEALSRGASSASFVERARPALVCLRENLGSLRLESRATVLAVDVRRALRSLGAEFDLVFADPPWAEVGAALEALSESPLRLARGARLVFEQSARDEPVAVVGGLSLVTSRTWGDTRVTWYGPDSPPIPSAEPMQLV